MILLGERGSTVERLVPAQVVGDFADLSCALTALFEDESDEHGWRRAQLVQNLDTRNARRLALAVRASYLT